jgi:hypothetical protein
MELSIVTNNTNKHGNVMCEVQYYFESQEERDEFSEKVKSARIGLGSLSEQLAINAKIYKGILMKRRMRNKNKKIKK